jgi:uncharacterized membrane protein (UPF0136 family)
MSRSNTPASDVSEVFAYKASWIDGVKAIVEHLPMPYWLVYLALFLVEVAVFHIVSWVDGWVAPFQFERFTLLFPFWLWGPLAAITYLDAVALSALREFRPLLKFDDEGVRRLGIEFTTMPSRPVIISGLLWSLAYGVICYVNVPIWTELYSVGPFALTIAIAAGLLTFFTGSIIYYHTIRQLRLVSQTVAKVSTFNLFRLDPVYAFSRLTARTGVVWILLVSITPMLFPSRLNPIPMIVLSLFQIALALAAFVLPLWSVHKRLVTEKRSLLADISSRVEAASRRLHRHLDEDDLTRIGDVKDAFAALAAERDVVDKIPTWPWRAGTLGGILSALALPIVLFLIQRILQRWLAP